MWGGNRKTECAFPLSLPFQACKMGLLTLRSQGWGWAAVFRWS